MLPSPDTLNEFPHGKFVLSNLAAKRANQLREGAMPLVQVESTHPLTIALAEIAAGKIKAILPSAETMSAIEPFASSGAGQVDGRRTGNIYRVVRPKPSKASEPNEFLQLLSREFKTLPFAERWAHRLDPKAPAFLNALVRTGAIMTYPALLDIEGGIVSQTEHTMIVGADGSEVTTA